MPDLSKTLNGSLQKVLNMRGVSYTWKTNAEISKIKGNKTDSVDNSRMREGTQLGVIAQEVEQIVPEVVVTDEDGFKSVDYIKLTPVLIEAVKEQQGIINQQQATIEGQNKKIESLEKQMEEMRKMMEELMKK